MDALIEMFRRKKAYELIKGIYPEIRGLKVVDLGSGQGKMAEMLRKEGAEVLTVDQTPSEGNYLTWNLEHVLPFKDKEFDLAISLAVVEHLNNPWLFLEEFKRIAHVCVGTTPHRRAKPVLETLASLKLINREHIKDHKRYFTEKELINLGFSCETFELGMNILFWRIT